MAANYTDLIGIPFVNRGRDMNGMDCYGLVMAVFGKHGIKLPEYTADFDDKDKISKIIKENQGNSSLWQRIDDIEELTVPCVMAMRFGVPKGIVNHTGVYIGRGKFIHTRESVGVCIDRINSPAWSKCIEGFYKYIGG